MAAGLGNEKESDSFSLFLPSMLGCYHSEWRSGLNFDLRRENTVLTLDQEIIL